MKNFVILGLLLVGFLVGGGCASVRKGYYENGNQFYLLGTYPFGTSNAISSIVCDIYNESVDGNIYVRRGGEDITSGPIKPGQSLTFEGYVAFMGEQINLLVQVWDKTHSRIIESETGTLTMNVRYGVTANTWTFRGSERTGIKGYKDGDSFYGGGYFFPYRY